MKQGRQLQQQKDSEDGATTPSNNLWVGNLAQDVTDSDLMGLFAKYGALDSVTAYSSRSYAFVFFKRVEDAKAAKDALQGAVLRGVALKIEFARPAKPNKSLWVGGISPSLSKQQLEEEFQTFGKIEEFKFLRDRNTAFIEYIRLEDAVEAMKSMNGKRIGGEQIRVDFLRSHLSRRDHMYDHRDSRENQFSSGLKRSQQPLSSGGRKEGPPSNVLWVGYPPSLQIDEQMLHNAMILFGEIERIKSFPSRNYSFVEFRSVDEARRAKEGLQGRLFNDPRITIMFSSSGSAPGKEYSNYYPGMKGRSDAANDDGIFGTGQLDMLENQQSIGRSIPPGNLHNSHLQLQHFGPQGGLDHLNDLVSHHTSRDSGPNSQLGPTWRRPSPPTAGILPSPGSRIRPSMKSGSSGWDGHDSSLFQREPKRSRIGTPDDDSFPLRSVDDRGLGLRTHALGPLNDKVNRFANVPGNNSVRGPVETDYIWRGIIAKGGTPVCHARCVPIGDIMEAEFPEVVNCSARTGLDMLAKHYTEAIGFDIVFFLPDSEHDFASYTEFLRYLSSKDRAGVVKFDDGTTLFLVPPSDFLTNVLKVAGPERLYGVVLKLPQQLPSNVQVQQHLHHPAHLSQDFVRDQFPPEARYNPILRKDEQVMQLEYNDVMHDESKLPSRSFYPPIAESPSAASVSRDYPTSSQVSASSGVSLTPELIASLSSLLPAKAQVPGSESVSTVRHSSSVGPDRGTPPQGWRPDYLAGNSNNLQSGNQSNSQAQFQPLLHQYPLASSTASHPGSSVPSTIPVQDFNVNLSHQMAAQSRPLTSFPVASPSGQMVFPPQVNHQYQIDPYGTQRSYGTAHGSDAPVPYSPSVVQQPNNPVPLPSNVPGGNYLPTQSGIQQAGDVQNQAVQSQTPQSGAVQTTSETEVDKNQRYQSTLQFAANLLLQIQQQQQTNTSGAPGSGNQQ
ncbi:Flowering time control protein FPA [Linum perenne]